MNPERKGFIFAKVGVRIAGHPRFLRIPAKKRAAALGLWTAALCFSRGEQLDGFCPFEAIQAIATEDIVDRLIEVGLFSREEQDGVHGVRVLKYEEFNDTKEQIESGRLRARTKKHKQRHGEEVALVPSSVPLLSLGTAQGSPPFLPSSSSSSVSDQGDKIDPEGSTSETRLLASAPETGIRHRAPGGGTPNVNHDGCFGDAVRVFQDSLATARKRPVTRLQGGELAKFLAILDANCAAIPERVEWARELGTAFAESGETTLNVYRLDDWLGRGRRTAKQVAMAGSGHGSAPLTADGLDPNSFEASQLRKVRRKSEDAAFFVKRLALARANGEVK